MDPYLEQLTPPRPLYQRLIIWTVVAGLVIAAGFGAVWGYGKAKLWRAHALTREGQQLVDQQKPADAEPKLMAAYTLAPRDPEVLRALARYELALHNANAVGIYHLLVALPTATRADQREAVQCFLAFDDLKSAEEWSDLLMREAPGAEDYALRARVCWIAGARTQAITFIRQAVAVDPASRTTRLILGQMLSLLPADDLQGEGQKVLRDLAAVQDAEGLKALEALAADPRVDAATEQGVLEQIRGHPLLDDDGRLAGWELEKRLGLRDDKAVMTEAMRYFQGGKDLARKAMAARWLYNEGQPQLVLELATQREAPTNQELFLVRMDALALLRNWAEVQKELSDTAPLPQAIAFLYRARAALELGQAARSDDNWDRARVAATTETGMLAYLGEYAMKAGLYNQAIKTYTQMAHTPSSALEGYTALLRVEAQHGTNAQLLEALKGMMADLPTRPEPKNDWAYLNLLLDTNIDQAFALAQSLVAANPEILAYRTTLALAYLRKNDPAGAQRVYQGLQIDWNTAPSSAKLIYSVVLAANGDKAQAAVFLHSLDRSQVRAEEWALIGPYFPGA